uniref:Integrase catalytic domain-containing protein n=1 Tax=Vitis vinifera TaxID=29760 RepID=A5AU78_VITVI|nr:hypothetical protein VITISV_001401 [Vitis vinifera]
MDFELAYYLVCTRGREIETRKIGKTLTWFPHLKDLVSGCLRSRMHTNGERYIYVGNGNKAAVKAIGLFRCGDVLELIHMNICGQFPTPSWNGQQYFITFIDDYSRYGYLYLIHEKFQSLDVFKNFKAEVEDQLSKKIKAIRSNRGGEYYGKYDGSGEQRSGPFAKYLMECGFINVMAKAFGSYFKSTYSKACCVKGKQTNMRKNDVNRCGDVLELIHMNICGQFPTPSWNGQQYFITFIDDYSRYGYLYLIHEKFQSLDVFKNFKAEVEDQLSKKIKAIRSNRGGEYYGKYDGSGEQRPGPFAKYLMECGIVPQYTMSGTPSQNGVVERQNHTLKDMARPYKLNEKKLDSRTVSCYFVGYSKRSRGFKFYDPSTRSFFETDNAKFIEDVELSGREPLRKVVFEEESISIPIITTGHGHIMFDDTIQNEFNMGLEDDPISISQVKQSSDFEKWIETMKDEMKSMKDNGVWDLVELPKGVKLIIYKWIFKTKRDSKGNIVRYKARLVAKGFTQKEDIDYKETFSPVSLKDSFRIIMALVAHYDLELHQMNVKTAFLNGNIDETIYMVQPKNFESNDSKQLVCRLKRFIYGLKQASRQCGSKFIILVLYVDDILLASGDVELLHETKRFLSSKFDMKDLGNASFVLDIQIYRDRSRGILGLSQKSYIDKVLSRFGISNCALGDMPVAKGDKFSLHQCPKNELENKDMERFPYGSAVGSLMYAQVCTRLDIAYIVGMLGRYLSNLDSDFAGCLDSRRSTLGYIFMLVGGAVSWKSVKQTVIASSTMEAEFIACYEASNHGIWLRNFITQLRIVDGIQKPLRIDCDNKAAKLYSKNNQSSSKSKHIDIKFLVVKERVQSLQVSIEHINTDSIIADPLTKSLPPKAYHEHVTHMGVVHIDDVLV